MKKLLIIISSQKPVPAVRNGAIEVRVENILKYNETHPMYDITVISTYDAEAVLKSEKYKNTKFWYVKTSEWEKKIYFYCKAIIRRLPLIQVVPPKELYHLKCFFKLRRHKNRFDKILIENVVPLVEKTKKISNAPVYLHLGSDGLNNGTPRAREIVKSLERILVVSDYIGSLVKGIPGIDPEKVIKINQGIERSLFAGKQVRSRDELRQSLGINPDDVVYEFHGRITPDKGVKELVLTFSALQHENVKLMILGSKSSWTVSDSYVYEIRTLAEELQEKVILPGEIPHDQIGDYLKAADVAVLPPLWEEPASNAILEAMMAGLPLITTDSGGSAEYCDAKASYVVPRDKDLLRNIAAAMEDLYQHPEKRAEMGKIAETFGMRFTAENHAKEVFDALGD